MIRRVATALLALLTGLAPLAQASACRCGFDFAADGAAADCCCGSSADACPCCPASDDGRPSKAIGDCPAKHVAPRLQASDTPTVPAAAGDIAVRPAVPKGCGAITTPFAPDRRRIEPHPQLSLPLLA